jgi:hypothetical protein
VTKATIIGSLLGKVDLVDQIKKKIFVIQKEPLELIIKKNKVSAKKKDAKQTMSMEVCVTNIGKVQNTPQKLINFTKFIQKKRPHIVYIDELNKETVIKGYRTYQDLKVLRSAL